MAEVINAPPNNAGADDVFLYMGERGPSVPRDVVRVRVHSSVTVIPESAFLGRKTLEEVELCEGLIEIGRTAFRGCSSLRAINFPTTIRAIGGWAFCGTCVRSIILPDGMEVIGHEAFRCAYDLQHVRLPSTLKRIEQAAFCGNVLETIELPDGLESIGDLAFYCCKFACIRIPPLITTIPGGCFERCALMFSIELPENLCAIKERDEYSHIGAFDRCKSLRNITIPPDTEVDCNGLKLFQHCNDLQQILGSQILQALRARFDRLPIHKMIYYQSYKSVTPDLLDAACNLRSGQPRALRSKLNPTGNQKDSLGMTPLHILACSSKQDLALYKIIIDKYPENLITQDRWGALPILYALWRNAPSDIIQFLSESYQSIYPDYELNWDSMVKTLGLAFAPQEVIQKLLDVKQSHFPEQVIGWDGLLNSLVEGYRNEWRDDSKSIFQFLLQRSISKRVNAIGVKQWRKKIMSIASAIRFTEEFLSDIRTKIAHYERQYNELKEGTSVLELALWKAKIDESQSTYRSQQRTIGRKKIKMDAQECRYQCRISSGAETVIRNVLPYLV